MSQISYFVYYRCGEIYGRAEINREKPVFSIKDVAEMEDELLKHWVEWQGLPIQGNKILIVHWQRFEEP